MVGTIERVSVTLLCFAMLGSFGPLACSESSNSRDAGPGGHSGGQSGAGGNGGGPGGTGVSCSQQQQSCAAGEGCCSGLICCRGVPVQPGQEFCSSSCPMSDRNMKQDVAAVDEASILNALTHLPISTWSYKAEGTKVKHIGPMAQDFMAAFNIGSSDKTILQVDGDGVAFAAIQALHKEMKRLERQNLELARQLERLRTATICPSAEAHQRLVRETTLP